MKQITTFFVLLSLGFTAFGQNKLELNQLFPIDAGHSYIEFSIMYMGYARVKGRFAEFTGLVRYDPGNVANTSASLSIKTESIDTDLDFRDKDLKSENWFDAVKFPLILFKSKSAKKTSTGFELTGDITIKGVTKEIILKMAPPSGVVKDARSDLQAVFNGTTTLDRTAFGVEGKNWSGIKEGVAAVANDVTIEFGILGKQFQLKNFDNRVQNTPNPAKIYKVIKELGLAAGLTEFRAMVENKSVQPPALVMVGNLLRLEGKNDDALAVFEANKDAFPDRWEVYYSLGEISLARGERDKARTYFMEAQKRDPENVNVMEVLRDLQ